MEPCKKAADGVAIAATIRTITQQEFPHIPRQESRPPDTHGTRMYRAIGGPASRKDRKDKNQRRS